MAETNEVKTVLPIDSKARKDIPIVSGCLDYFPAALAAVAEVSRIGNEKHNPGEPMHHAREKSGDHADCVGRHLMERGKFDSIRMPDGRYVSIRHSAEGAWRYLALLQEELEAAGAPLARAAKLPVTEQLVFRGVPVLNPAPPKKTEPPRVTNPDPTLRAGTVLRLTNSEAKAARPGALARLIADWSGGYVNVIWLDKKSRGQMDGKYFRQDFEVATPLRVYVAGKFERIEEARFMQGLLRERGHLITHDWTQESAGDRKGGALDDFLRRCAEADEQGVKTADAVVLIHDDNCRGGFWEAGGAAILGKPVLVIGGEGKLSNEGGWKAPIFYRLSNVHHYDSPVQAAGDIERVAALYRQKDRP
jgi:hypothetical protein